MSTAQKLEMNLVPLRTSLLDGRITLEALVDLIYKKIEIYRDHNVWIHVLPKEEVLRKAEVLWRLQNKQELPLFGIPYAVKDNIDVAGIPTTAACEKFSYIPKDSADVVKKLDEAGALMIGKTNLDQFATGLVGPARLMAPLKTVLTPPISLAGPVLDRNSGTRFCR